MTNTLVKWATRSRPALFLRKLPDWLADDSVSVLVSIDADDATCNNPDFLSRVRAMAGDRVSVRIGHSKGKIEAINDGVAETDWEFLILAADDWRVERPDYARHLRRILFDRWPDGDGVLHLNDGRAGRALNTGAVMGRKYFDRFGYVYHPSYLALWSDNELGEVAESLGRSLWIPEVILHHEWTDVTGADELHQRNERSYQDDAAVYERRRLAGFPV